MNLKQKDKFTLVAGIISFFAFLTIFFPPLFEKNGGNLYFYQVFFGAGLDYYKGATLSAVAYFVLLAIAIGFVLCTFTKLKNYKIIKIVLSVLAVASSFVIVVFTPELFVNGMWASDHVGEELLNSARAEQLALLERGVSLYFCFAFGVLSSAFGILPVINYKKSKKTRKRAKSK